MMRTGKKAAGSPGQHTPRHAWETLSDDQLLSLRFCDLKLRVRGTELEAPVQRLYRELELRGIRFRPHCCLAQEWSPPDGIPEIPIPFDLAPPPFLPIDPSFLPYR